MTDYPLGTVVLATVRGVPGQQVMPTNWPNKALGWVSASFVMGCRFHPHADVTDIEVVYTPPRPRMAEPDPVEWQVVAHTAIDPIRRNWLRLPVGFLISGRRDFADWADLIDPEPYRPDDAPYSTP